MGSPPPQVGAGLGSISPVLVNKAAGLSHQYGLCAQAGVFFWDPFLEFLGHGGECFYVSGYTRMLTQEAGPTHS